MRHTFVSMFGEEEVDAILTDAGEKREAYASRMKGMRMILKFGRSPKIQSFC